MHHNFSKTDAHHYKVKQAASDEQALLFLCKSLEAPRRPLSALKLSSVKTHSCYRLLEFAPAHTGPRRICRDVLQVHVPATIRLYDIRHGISSASPENEEDAEEEEFVLDKPSEIDTSSEMAGFLMPMLSSTNPFLGR